MSRDLAVRMARRAIVLAATVAVIGAGVVTVQTAAIWRSQAAPLDAAPVSMSSINDDLDSEVGRAANLSSQIDAVASQVRDLRTAVTGANGAVAGQVDNATAVQKQLDAAKAKLKTMQEQLTAAQNRLSQLNAAAARQAALNAAAAKRATSSRSPGGATTTPAPITQPHDD